MLKVTKAEVANQQRLDRQAYQAKRSKPPKIDKITGKVIPRPQKSSGYRWSVHILVDSEWRAVEELLGHWRSEICLAVMKRHPGVRNGCWKVRKVRD